MNTEQMIWLGLMILFLIFEGLTPGLTSIWFALGSLAALVSAFFGASILIQTALFFLISIVALILTRPIARDYLNRRVQATNADMVIGGSATVTERIDNVAGTGMASVSGRLWTARSADGNIIEAGTLTTVKAIEGVKLLLVPQSVPQTIVK